MCIVRLLSFLFDLKPSAYTSNCSDAGGAGGPVVGTRAGAGWQPQAGGGRWWEEEEVGERHTEAHHTPPTEPDVRPVTQLTTGSLHL